MNFLLLVVGILIAIILALLVWSAGKKNAIARDEVCQRKGIHLACKHLGNLPQMRQALESSDFAYVEERLGKRSAQKLHRERRRVAHSCCCTLAQRPEIRNKVQAYKSKVWPR